MRNIYLIYLAVMNIWGFMSMYFDKQKAIHNKWRTTENHLLLIAVLGGSIGSYIGMKKFRHKTKHIKFMIVVPLMIVQ